MTSGMMDIAILAVTGLFGFLGWKRGLIRTLSELAAVLLSMLLASQLSVPAARQVVDKTLRPAAEDAVRTQISALAGETSRTAREKVDAALEAIPSRFVREQAQALLEKTSLPGRAEDAGREVLEETALQLTGRVLDTAVYKFVHSLLYALIFAVSNLVLRLALRALNLAAKLPGLRELNGIGGLALGAGKGLIIVYLCLWVLGRTGALPPEAVDGSFLAGLAGELLKSV